MRAERPIDRVRLRTPGSGPSLRPLHRVAGILGFAAGVGTMGAFIVWQALLFRQEAPSPSRPGALAVAIDLALIGSFGLVHSLLAREGLRRRLSTAIHPGLERSAYTGIAALQPVAMIALWRPVRGVVWEVEIGPAATGLWALHALGWLVAVLGFRAAGTAHLFGLAQARASAEGRVYVEPPLVTSGPYAWIRHPLYAGTLVALWTVPTMTVGRFLLAAGLSAYIAIGARFEERDLERRHGAGYHAYRSNVPGFVPIRSRDRPRAAPPE